MLGLLDDLERNRFEIFRSLTLLRQLSLDAALVDDEHAGVPSTKLDALHRAARRGRRRGPPGAGLQPVHPVPRPGPRAAGRAPASRYCYLDGTTRDRAAVIDEFKTGDAPVFLISLKAGGFGLNLTEADYCFLLDPWWNPATEAQAVDRTHRIGQTSNVMVYRLVAKDTIEEKVMALKAARPSCSSSVMDDGALRDGRGSPPTTSAHCSSSPPVTDLPADPVADRAAEARERMKQAAQRAHRNPSVRASARIGLLANGLVHALIGGIGLGIANGRTGEADQLGALSAIANGPGGVAVLWLSTVSLWGLALWQGTNAAFSVAPNRRVLVFRRSLNMGKALGFALLGTVTFAVALGARAGGPRRCARRHRHRGKPGGTVPAAGGGQHRRRSSAAAWSGAASGAISARNCAISGDPPR